MATLLERIANGRTDLVIDYVAQGHPSTAADGDGTPLIQWCAYYGDVSAIRFLLEKGESLRSLGENLGLGAAAFHGHWRLCEFLLENGADAGFREPDTGETALHAALCTTRRVAHDLVVRVLLDAGADPDAATTSGVETGASREARDANGDTPLSWGSWYARPDEILRRLLYGSYSIHPNRQTMEGYLQGTPTRRT